MVYAKDRNHFICPTTKIEDINPMTHDIEKLKQDIVSWLNDENRVWPEWTALATQKDVIPYFKYGEPAFEVELYNKNIWIDGFVWPEDGNESVLRKAHLIGLDLSKYRI